MKECLLSLLSDLIYVTARHVRVTASAVSYCRTRTTVSLVYSTSVSKPGFTLTLATHNKVLRYARAAPARREDGK